MADATPTRSLFATKTAAAQYITALAGVATLFWPSAQQFVADHATHILFGLPVLNLAIRAVTHGRVSLLGDGE